ncbi:TrkH family potassium uptake protein [Zongyangia hominis]|uniref:TrkH family potassium uptake protein n=1 Tax=Zongyangia hominis TaxID=2763677 RepID=UPI0021CCB811|nr:potassium transporter TrkG [Zongyangia hominis]
MICGSFFLVITIGTILLMMPFATRAMVATPLHDALFTATSATCVTGLIVYDTYTYWSTFGQLVILTLIQIGGLGLVTITTFFNIALGRKLGLRGLQLAQESINVGSIIDVTRLTKMVMAVSFSVEAVGALILATQFVPKFGGDGIFLSIFLAISAFCNAGFDLLGRESPFVSLMNYNGEPVVLYTIAALIIIGGLGFVVIHDLYNYRKTKKLMLHTKMVLVITGILILVGALFFLLLEWNNPQTMGHLSVGEKLNASIFQSVTTRTAGFNSVDMGGMHGLTKAIAIVLMFIGAAPGSTGGGIKVTTAAVILMLVVSVVRGREDAVMFHRKIAQRSVYKAVSVVVLAVLAVCISSIILYSDAGTAPVAGIDAIFESVSAFATVGLSTGVTGVATVIGKLVLTFTMFLGRVGPVSFALSVAARAAARNKKEIIPEAKIMVG